MLNSNERMGFIIEYMSSYDEKIKMANKNGLFDAAKMFELFAIEVCNVWFGQKFSNLNDETATYPYVDLISENRELLVQVSTVQDVPTKIKTTLEKIRDSKDKKCSDLKNIVFFVLSNNSIDKVREYSGDNQIGSISFTIKDNLITTNDIITKAQNDLNFQKKLYKVLKDEYENFNITTRYMLYKKNPTKELLERQILKTVGISELKDRYELDKKCDLSIQEYVSHTQIYFDSMVQDKCYGILDYLYSIIKNDAENAQDYLQIQKMDMRGAKATKITDNIIMLEPQISGEAEKIVLRQEEFNKPKQRLNAAIKKCNDNMVSGQIDLPSTLDAIKVILELMKDTDMAFQYENLLILLIASAINHQELENEKREKFCTIWINGIEKLFSNGSFLADTALMPVLLNQLENDVAIGIKNKIKEIVLDCLMYKGQHGVIDEMAKYVKRYLANHETLAQAVFNTIIKLSEDQMEHQKYNANYLKVSKKDKEFIFNPNMQPKLSGIDRYIKDDDGNCYTSREEEIIDRYVSGV